VTALWKVLWKLRRRLGVLVVPALLLGACAGGPQPVHWGVEECAHCQMVISDDRFAGQVVDRRGNTYKFDAIECMAAFLNGRAVAAEDVAGAWVADGPDAWVPSESATFVHSADIRSPMGGGYTAHADSDAARQLHAEVGGILLTWRDVLERVERDGHADHGGHDAAHGPAGGQ
jgi:copper chaperone NosL